MKLISSGRILAGIAAALSCSSAFAQNINGAIYTSTAGGEIVDKNLYDAKLDVYLNGGPRNQTGSRGLDDGFYYFMVTDPSGKYLLSTGDPTGETSLPVEPIQNREVWVFMGRMYGLGAGTGTHAEGSLNTDSSSIPICLFPFIDTPNAGGEYKAWLTKVEDYNPSNTHSYFGFIEHKSKTDNFKVKTSEPPPPPLASTITLLKFNDLNHDHVWDLTEPAIAGWKFLVTYTDADGNGWTDREFTTDPSGFVVIDCEADSPYVAVEETDPAWYQTFPYVGSSADDQFAVGDGQFGYEGQTPGEGGNFERDYGNSQTTTIRIHKYFDQNNDGIEEAGEPPLSGFTFTLRYWGSDSIVHTVTLTSGTNGNDSYDIPYGSSGTVTEDATGSQWTLTQPIGGDGYDLSSAATDESFSFGNALRGDLTVTKYFDANDNGIKDAGDYPLAGWKFDVTYQQPGDSGSTTKTITTDGSGVATLSGLLYGTTYSIVEQIPPGWSQTGSTGSTGTVGSDLTSPSASSTLTASATFLNTVSGNLVVGKWLDLDMDGVHDANENGITGWTLHVHLVTPSGVPSDQDVTTGAGGTFTITGLPYGTQYSVTETVPTGWLQTGFGTSGTIGNGVTVDPTTTLAPALDELGNIPEVKITGHKYYDARANHDTSQPIVGWKLTITSKWPNGSLHTETVTTGAGGVYTSSYMPVGSTYTVTESLTGQTLAGTWVNTAPLSVSGGPLAGAAGATVTGPDFFNRRSVGTGHGLTLGFWSNNNGQAVLKAHDPAWRSAVSPAFLANGNTYVVPAGTAAYNSFNNWLLSASATNMAYMTSVQLTAQKLNISFNGQDGNLIVGNTGLSINQIIANTTALLTSAGGNNTVKASTLRTQEQYYETLLDDLNNNRYTLYAPGP